MNVKRKITLVDTHVHIRLEDRVLKNFPSPTNEVER